MDLTLGDTQLIIKECKAQKVTRAQAAYILATAYWETARSMKPIKETVMPHHKDKNPSDATVISRLDHAFHAGRLGQVRTPYWREGWFGRGFVQLTHKRNYERATKELGIDFVSDPAKAMQPVKAAKILVMGMMQGWFTGASLPRFINETEIDYVNARRVVNGLDRANDIAAYAKQYYDLLDNYATKSLASSRTIAGQVAAGAGTAGAALSEQADAIAPLVGMSDTLRTVFILLTIAGIALTIYARIDDSNKGRR
jgi:hypothetical protein